MRNRKERSDQHITKFTHVLIVIKTFIWHLFVQYKKKATQNQCVFVSTSVDTNRMVLNKPFLWCMSFYLCIYIYYIGKSCTKIVALSRLFDNISMIMASKIV